MKERFRANPSEYHVEKPLGEGLNSCVYKAYKRSNDILSDHPIAIKILKSKTSVEKWRLEIDALAKVRSSYCAAYLGWEVIEGKFSILMEYIDGVSLEELSMSQALNKEEIREIQRQAQLGIKDISKYGYVHGDLSAANILISKRGEVRLIDFGFSLINQSADQVTVEFASPEALMGRPLSFASDLFSLGKILKKLSLGVSCDLYQEINPLLEYQIEKRRPVEILINQSAIKSLSKKVKKAARHKKHKKERTEAIVTSFWQQLRFGCSRIKPYYLRVIAFVLVSGSVSFSQATFQNHQKKLRGALTISSNQWLKIWIDGKEMGYAPISQHLLRPGTYVLKWESGSRVGFRTLTIEKGSHIVLEGAAFNN